MTLRTTRQTVIFAHPFRLSGLEEQPAGSYTVETEDELLNGVSFPVRRRVATLMFLPPTPGLNMTQIVTIDPRELEAALERDVKAGESDGTEAPHSKVKEPNSTNDLSPAKPSMNTILSRLLQKVVTRSHRM